MRTAPNKKANGPRDSIIGSIRLEPRITEAPAWEENARILIISDSEGRRHGRVEWLESEVDVTFCEALESLASVAMRPRSGRAS